MSTITNEQDRLTYEYRRHPMKSKDDPFEIELGSTLTDRLGLIPATTHRDYETEQVAGKVMVTSVVALFSCNTGSVR